jgi:hypothetical protein
MFCYPSLSSSKKKPTAGNSLGDWSSVMEKNTAWKCPGRSAWRPGLSRGILEENNNDHRKGIGDAPTGVLLLLHRRPRKLSNVRHTSHE